MRIRYSQRFEKRFRRLPYADKKAAREAIAHFLEQPQEPMPGRHALRGTMARQHSLSVDHDLRIIYTVKGDYEELLFLDIGTHADVYRK